MHLTQTLKTHADISIFPLDVTPPTTDLKSRNFAKIRNVLLYLKKVTVRFTLYFNTMWSLTRHKI